VYDWVVPVIYNGGRHEFHALNLSSPRELPGSSVNLADTIPETSGVDGAKRMNSEEAFTHLLVALSYTSPISQFQSQEFKSGIGPSPS
jgi:hypothetical protein